MKFSESRLRHEALAAEAHAKGDDIEALHHELSIIIGASALEHIYPLLGVAMAKRDHMQAALIARETCKVMANVAVSIAMSAAYSNPAAARNLTRHMITAFERHIEAKLNAMANGTSDHLEVITVDSKTGQLSPYDFRAHLRPGRPQ